MSVSNEFLQYVVDMLSSIGDIKTKRMFSGVLLEIRGKQLGILFQEKLYFKIVDPDMQIWYLSQGSEQFSYLRKDKKEPIVIKNWWLIPERFLDEREGLCSLAVKVLAQYK